MLRRIAFVASLLLTSCSEFRAGMVLNEASQKLVSGDNRGAIRKYEEALRLDPTLGPALYGKGLALRALGQTSEAMSAFRGAITLDPGDVYSYLELGKTQAKDGLLAEAIATFGEAHKRFPSDAEIRNQLEYLRNLKFAETMK